ncbi:DinB family protein [Cytobacillus kochii]|uniref:DinB family protein n=1 Tax=Cytobacillus kochii TaxID=859143 RepID=UPI001F436F8F|nr:DinB family protein [Cytobacillus kochii]
MERKETMIENVSNHIQTVRLLTIQSLDKINPAFISTVPKGFNNNIHWNFGHIAYIQERLVFELTGERMGIGSEYETFFCCRYCTTSLARQYAIYFRNQRCITRTDRESNFRYQKQIY